MEFSRGIFQAWKSFGKTEKKLNLAHTINSYNLTFFHLSSGTLYAAIELIKQQKAEVLGCLVVVELKYLNGSDKLKPTPVFSLIQYWRSYTFTSCAALSYFVGISEEKYIIGTMVYTSGILRNSNQFCIIIR